MTKHQLTIFAYHCHCLATAGTGDKFSLYHRHGLRVEVIVKGAEGKELFFMDNGDGLLSCVGNSNGAVKQYAEWVAEAEEGAKQLAEASYGPTPLG